MSNGGPVFWTGKTVFDVIGDPATYADAMTAVLSEMWIDANVLCSGTTTPAGTRPSLPPRAATPRTAP